MQALGGGGDDCLDLHTWKPLSATSRLSLPRSTSATAVIRSSGMESAVAVAGSWRLITCCKCQWVIVAARCLNSHPGWSELLKSPAAVSS